MTNTDPTIDEAMEFKYLLGQKEKNTPHPDGPRERRRVKSKKRCKLIKKVKGKKR